jgi:hypothetical protein
MLPDEEAVAVLVTTGVFGRIGADAEGTSVFAAGVGDMGSTGDAALAGTVSTGLTFLGTLPLASTGLTSLATLPPEVVGVEDAVATATGIGGSVGASTVGGFADATDAAGNGQR